MQVLFSADLHIKVGQKNVPKDWQTNRYRMFFKKVYELENEADVHIIGGDIFDKLPNIAEIQLFLEFISGIGIRTYIFDGNHEAGRKGHTFLTLLANIVSKINPLVTILDGITVMDDLDMDIIPYTHLKTFNPDDFHNLYLCTHVRGEIKPHVVPEIDLSKFDRWKTVLAGDLHSYTNSQRNIVYPGSPMTISFHRNKTTNGVIIFDTQTNEHRFIALELPQLIRKTVETEEEIVSTDYDHTIYELVGDISSLSNIDTAENSIIDKKIIKRDAKASLALSNLSMLEELALYLEEVEVLDADTIKSILEVYNDYT